MIIEVMSPVRARKGASVSGRSDTGAARLFELLPSSDIPSQGCDAA